jgi:hemerythrin
MNSFYVTTFRYGIASVDEQHQQLVDIINRLGVALISRNENTEVTDSVYAELSNYALHHFADEEDLMTRVGLDPAHVLPHQLHHQQFVEQLGALWAGRSQLSQPVDALLGFLCSWLTFHILEEDQRMARQIERVRQGMSPAEALACEGVRIDVGSAALLAAMQRLTVCWRSKMRRSRMPTRGWRMPFAHVRANSSNP